MRPLLAVAIFLLGVVSAAPEPDYSSYFSDYLHAALGRGKTSLIEIESSTARGDRLAVAALRPRVVAVETFRPTDTASIEIADADPTGSIATDDDDMSSRQGDVSVDDLCRALFISAQNNDLPIPFFANLIWQESRLRDDAVSSKGAQGIAQFMPETAAETGLDNPFDPMQAIRASARFLRELRQEFGNLGFVAAAYNAGPRRVIEWLEHRGSLPRETRGYVVRVTGLSVDEWRHMAVNDDALAFVRHLPCRSLPAFANVEQAHADEVQAQQAKVEQIKLEEAKLERAEAKKAAARARDSRAEAHKSGRNDHPRRNSRRTSRPAPERRARAGNDPRGKA